MSLIMYYKISNCRLIIDYGFKFLSLDGWLVSRFRSVLLEKLIIEYKPVWTDH